MKKTGYFLGILLGLMSCNKKELYQAPDVENLLPLESRWVEVPEGKVALIRFYEDTLAVVTESADVMIPKANVLTKSFENAISIEYLEKNNVLDLVRKWKVYQVLAFEDSEQGDYDYNDLVVHVKVEQGGNNTTVYVHPVALGSIKTITFGVEIDGQEVILAEDCRADLFDGKKGFINTAMDDSGIRYKYTGLKKTSINIACNYGCNFNWFIDVDGGKRLYAVSKDYGSFNNEMMVYGLILANIRTVGYRYKGADCGYDWFDYPQEEVHIWEVYPEFNGYMKGVIGSFQVFSVPEEGKYYPAIVAAGKDVSEDCLYAVTFPG